MTRYLVLFLLLGATPVWASDAVDEEVASEKKVSFSIARPVNGTYRHYRKGERPGFGGEVITIVDDRFRYHQYSDAMDESFPEYAGKITFTEDRIFLDHPGVGFPYRIAGVMDGVPVLLIWPVFQKLKETGRIPQYGVLYLREEEKDPTNS